MPALSFAPAFSFLTAFSRHPAAHPIRTLIRTTEYKLRPPRPLPFQPSVRTRQDLILAAGKVAAEKGASILRERRKGPVPTIVLGGFVPDATEQVFLLRGFLLKHGSVYYINYPRQGFSIDLVIAQLDDLVEELTTLHGQRPVIFSVSFGAGIVLEWLKRVRREGRQLNLQGTVLISPVACVEDLLVPGEPKPTTLLGRALKPYLETETHIEPGVIDKSRAIFTKMFEAGAQNRESLRVLMTNGELKQLHEAVIGTIRSIDFSGACERVQALRQFEAPSNYFCQELLPLSDAPSLILYSEKESAVITEQSPTRSALESAHRVYFPRSHYRVISNHRGSPVQHASLIFHCFNFLPPISAFYKHVRTGKLLQLA